jgi:dolichyl-phosphate-mannose-protein mannosyltransferase
MLVGHWQYSQYSGVTVPTLNRSNPMATMGGEPGGRAPIVVEDRLEQDAVAFICILFHHES